MATQTTIAAALQEKINSKAALKTAFERRGLTVGTAKLSEYAGILDTLPTWSRPSDWLKIDSLVLSSDHKMVGLYAVYPDVNDYGMTNTVAFVIKGNHTIDWGDGSTIENVNSNVQAQHTYTYASLSSNTYCTRGYRQAIITITPQSGQNITNIQLGKKHTSVVQGRIFSQWLDITLSGANISTFRISEISFANLLENFKAVQSTTACTSLLSTFQYCYSLQTLNLSSFNTALVTNMSYMFTGCTSLQTLNLSSFNTALVTNMSNMFQYCYSLQTLNLSSFNTALVTNMSYMFNSCTSLQTLNLSSFNTALVTNMSYMFYSCYSLQTLNLSSFNTALVTNMSNMFQYCASLQTLNLSQTTFNSVTPVGNFAGFLGSNGSLTLVRIPHVLWSFTVSYNPISDTNLNLLFGDLDTTTGQTITITGCTGAATCNKTLATNKGWTVVG
jgi:surface protein